MRRSGVRPQEEEDHDSRHRDVEPDGQCVARDLPVGLELARRRIVQSAEDHRQRHHGQRDMANQNEEIDGPDQAVPGERRVTVEVVVGDVTGPPVANGQF